MQIPEPAKASQPDNPSQQEERNNLKDFIPPGGGEVGAAVNRLSSGLPDGE